MAKAEPKDSVASILEQILGVTQQALGVSQATLEVAKASQASLGSLVTGQAAVMVVLNGMADTLKLLLVSSREIAGLLGGGLPSPPTPREMTVTYEFTVKGEKKE